MQVYAAVAGHPVQHSLTPALFKLVTDHVRSSDVDLRFDLHENIETVELPEAMAIAYSSKPPSSRGGERGQKYSRGEFWLSLTTPLKHMVPPESAIELLGEARQIACVNQLRHDGRGWRGAATDGVGLVDIAEEFGFEFRDGEQGQDSPLLCLHGGGSTARSCATAWADTGGSIWWKGGRRGLDARGPWSKALISGGQVADHLGRRLHIDFDVAPASSPSPDIGDAELSRGDSDEPDLIVSAAYGPGPVKVTLDEGDRIILDGRWLLCAQHLAAWRLLFRPKLTDSLPALSELVEQLAAM